nr:V-type ATP synthase subunit E family protein [uncultured Sellimonas sp.]
MTGLDKIISQILEEADALAAQKKADATATAEAVLAKAQSEAGELRAAIEEKAERELTAYQSRLKSSDEQKRRTALLKAKQEIISEMIEKAYEQFCSQETGVYFDTIKKMIARFALPEEGEILFSEKDLERMPAGLADEIARIAKEKGGSLIVSKEKKEMDGGFILVYNGIEENCSFRAVFDSGRDELQDKVQQLLFS